MQSFKCKNATDKASAAFGFAYKKNAKARLFSEPPPLRGQQYGTLHLHVDKNKEEKKLRQYIFETLSYLEFITKNPAPFSKKIFVKTGEGSPPLAPATKERPPGT